MTFDHHSLERLKKLGRKLPKEIKREDPLPSSSLNENNYKNLHPVEIEENPEQLFRELMEISPDGNVPPHLLDRLKKLESNSKKTSKNIVSNKTQNPEKLSSNEFNNLYTEFKQLLLED